MERRCLDCGLPCEAPRSSESPLCPHCKARRKRMSNLREEGIRKCDEYLARKASETPWNVGIAANDGNSQGVNSGRLHGLARPLETISKRGDGDKVDKPCEMCGEMMRGVSRQRRFCAKCADQRNLDRIKARFNANGCLNCGRSLENEPPQARYCADCRRARRERKAALREKRKKPLSLAAINELARTEGLSYGEYVRRYGL